MPGIQSVAVQAYDGGITGKITCSVPLSIYLQFFRWYQLTGSSIAAADGRPLVAVGCAEGVWIGLRHNSKCG